MIGAIFTTIKVVSSGYSLVKMILKDVEDQKESKADRKKFQKEFRKLPKSKRRDFVHGHMQTKIYKDLEEKYSQEIKSKMEQKIREEIEEKLRKEYTLGRASDK